MVNYNPNPFSFVPFSEDAPALKTLRDWLKSGGELLSGEISLEIEALTPVHIAGSLESTATGKTGIDKDKVKITVSKFRRINDNPCIPGSSVRGMVRSFIEAVTNGWVSEINPYYKREFRKRQVGFMTIDARKDIAVAGDIGLVEENIKLLPKVFRPLRHPEGKIDLASFLFGFVIDQSAAKGRLIFDDAPIEDLVLDQKNWCIPDISGTAILGGPNPSAKTWWYQVPSGLRKRKTKNGIVIDFLGRQLRGRKFYYHQDPNACVDWYLEDGNWQVPKRKKIYRYPIECLPPERKTKKFSIRFFELPHVLLTLLLWALQPGTSFCHKIGYGKPFGYGSIRFHINGLRIEPAVLSFETNIPEKMNILNQIMNSAWSIATLKNHGVWAHLHQPSLESLSRILYYKEPLTRLYTWPPFSRKGFLPVVNENDVKSAMTAAGIAKSIPSKALDIVTLTESEAIAIAKNISKKKKPALHFELYQLNATGYEDIQNRTLADALVC